LSLRSRLQPRICGRQLTNPFVSQSSPPCGSTLPSISSCVPFATGFDTNTNELVTGAVTVTEALAPAASVATLQLSSCVPLIAQVVQPV
jgi:hypothetical protein